MYNPVSFLVVWIVVIVVFLLPIFIIVKLIKSGNRAAEQKRKKEMELLQAQIDYYNAQKQALENN